MIKNITCLLKVLIMSSVSSKKCELTSNSLKLYKMILIPWLYNYFLYQMTFKFQLKNVELNDPTSLCCQIHCYVRVI